MVQPSGRGSFGCWPVGRSWPVSRVPPVAGVQAPACRPTLASADEDPVDGPRRLAPHRRAVGCVRRCRHRVSRPGGSASRAVQPDSGHPHRRARPVPAPGAPRGGMSRALLKLQRRLDSRLRNHLRRFPEPELRVARSERRHQLRHVLAAFDAAEALGRFQHPGGDPA